MIEDPQRRGRDLAAFCRSVSSRLLLDLKESGLVSSVAGADQVRDEWECFALYACVRGLVAAGGFNRETATAIDSFHEAILEAAMAEADSGEAFPVRRARIAERYAEYGTIGQEGGAAAAVTVTARLGAAAARHMTAPQDPPAGLPELVGSLHEALAEGAAEAVRRGE
jgi:hypothetical protein